MRRTVLLGAGLAMVMGYAGAANAQAKKLVVSGSTTVAIIDTDGDGPDSGDCSFMVELGDPASAEDPERPATIMGMQSTTGVELRACDGNFMGTAGDFLTSVFGVIDMNTHPGGNQALNWDGGFTGVGPGGLRELRTLIIRDGTSESNAVLGEGILCQEGGPTAVVSIPGAPPMLVPLKVIPGYLCVPNLPFQELGSSEFVMLDSYIPTTDGQINFALEGGAPQFQITLDALPECSKGTPALSGWGLVGLTLALLVGGTWVLSRRKGFQSLHLP